MRSLQICDSSNRPVGPIIVINETDSYAKRVPLSMQVVESSFVSGKISIFHFGNDGAAMLDSNNSNNEKHKPGELVIGLITFGIFIIFMTLWMYFGISD